MIILGGVGYYFWQKNIYSKDVLKLEIIGPEKADVFDEAEYIVKYKNNGNARLEEPILIFKYPKQSVPDDGQPLWQEKSLDAIYPGEEKTVSFKARLLGKEGDVLVAEAKLNYKPKDLKAKYESSTSFTTILDSNPLTFEFDSPLTVGPGKNFLIQLNYFSNFDYPLTDLRIQIDYPAGFEFIDSSPRALEKNEWQIPVLNKSQGGRVAVTGKLSGEIGEAKIFKAKFGVWVNDEFILLKEIERGIEIIEPSIYLRQEINENPQYTAIPGDWLHYKIYFKNIGEDALNNLSLIDKLEGDAFDFQTIKSDLGSYQAGDDSIVFDWKKVPKLKYLAPTDEGSIDFWIRLKEDLGQVSNPTLNNKVFISQVREEFITKISSKLEIVQKGYFQDEVFGNTGSIPPRVGQSTTYTTMWQAKNYYTDVKNVKVKALLPEGVELTGKIFPEEQTQKFSFDSESREIVWLVGDLGMGSGVLTQPSNIAFQVSLTPLESQRYQTPEIIGEAKINGEDSWTGLNIEFSSSAITTVLPDDQTMTKEKGTVQ